MWIEDPKLDWIDGEVLSIDGNKAHVQTTDGRKVGTLFHFPHILIYIELIGIVVDSVAGLPKCPFYDHRDFCI